MVEERYVRFSDALLTLAEDKANLKCKCPNNFKFDGEILYYKKRV